MASAGALALSMGRRRTANPTSPRLGSSPRAPPSPEEDHHLAPDSPTEGAGLDVAEVRPARPRPTPFLAPRPAPFPHGPRPILVPAAPPGRPRSSVHGVPLDRSGAPSQEQYAALASEHERLKQVGARGALAALPPP